MTGFGDREKGYIPMLATEWEPTRVRKAREEREQIRASRDAELNSTPPETKRPGEAATQEGKGEDPVLPFELPEYMLGLEGLIVEGALDMTEGATFAQDPERFTRAAALASIEYHHKIKEFRALARIATNQGSLHYKFKDAAQIPDLPQELIQLAGFSFQA